MQYARIYAQLFQNLVLKQLWDRLQKSSSLMDHLSVQEMPLTLKVSQFSSTLPRLHKASNSAGQFADLDLP